MRTAIWRAREAGRLVAAVSSGPLVRRVPAGLVMLCAARMTESTGGFGARVRRLAAKVARWRRMAAEVGA